MSSYFKALAVLFTLGGQKDVVRVGGTTTLMGIKSQIVSYNPNSLKVRVRVKNFFKKGQGRLVFFCADSWNLDWIASLKPWDLDKVDEVPFVNQMYPKSELFLEQILSCNLEDTGTQGNLWDACLRSRSMRSLSVMLMEPSFLSTFWKHPKTPKFLEYVSLL